MRNVKFKIQNLIFRYNLQLEEHWWMMYRGARMHYDLLTSSQYLNPGDANVRTLSGRQRYQERNV